VNEVALETFIDTTTFELAAGAPFTPIATAMATPRASAAARTRNARTSAGSCRRRGMQLPST
jgi:hypothetical protein